MTGIPTQTADVGARDRRVREAPLRAVGQRQAAAVLHQPDGAVPRPGLARRSTTPSSTATRCAPRRSRSTASAWCMPSWKHIMNYESDAMTPDEMVEATYDAALGINRVKAEAGIIDPATATLTEKRIDRGAGRRCDASTRSWRARSSAASPRSWRSRRSSTGSPSRPCARRRELNWPARRALKHVAAAPVCSSARMSLTCSEPGEARSRPPSPTSTRGRGASA